MPDAPITVLILSWNRPIYLWVTLDALYRYTRHPARFILIDNHSDDPGVRRVIRGFERRGMFERVEWADTNSPTRAFEAMHKYRHLFGSFFVYIESDVAVFPSYPCWLGQFVGLMERHPSLAMLGSYVDGRDFIDPRHAAAFAPDLDEGTRGSLIKHDSPERRLSMIPPKQEIIEPDFNPPGRFMALRTELLDAVTLDVDDALWRNVMNAGFSAGIATGVRHRHLSLLNFWDYSDYDVAARDRHYAEAHRYGEPPEAVPDASTSRLPPGIVDGPDVPG